METGSYVDWMTAHAAGLTKEIAKLGKTVIGALTRVPVVDDFLDRLRRRYLNEIVVRRIRSERDRDLPAALELYERRIPNPQRVESADLMLWLSERRDTDYCLVAKLRKKVCGFSFFHYYPERGIAFFSYM